MWPNRLRNQQPDCYKCDTSPECLSFSKLHHMPVKNAVTAETHSSFYSRTSFSLIKSNHAWAAKQVRPEVSHLSSIHQRQELRVVKHSDRCGFLIFRTLYHSAHTHKYVGWAAGKREMFDKGTCARQKEAVMIDHWWFEYALCVHFGAINHSEVLESWWESW